MQVNILPEFFLQHPVYCLKVVGTQNSHNVISISTDGKLCSWSLDMLGKKNISILILIMRVFLQFHFLFVLAAPQEILDLQHKQNKAVAGKKEYFDKYCILVQSNFVPYLNVSFFTATCLAFPQQSVNNFVIGSEEGSVYSGMQIILSPI